MDVNWPVAGLAVCAVLATAGTVLLHLALRDPDSEPGAAESRPSVTSLAGVNSPSLEGENGSG